MFSRSLSVARSKASLGRNNLKYLGSTVSNGFNATEFKTASAPFASISTSALSSMKYGKGTNFVQTRFVSSPNTNVPFLTISELIRNACKEYANNKSFGTRKGAQYEWVSYKELYGMIEKFRNVLSHHKIGKDDKVALISNNRLEWAVAMYAIAGVGGQLVPMYESQLEKDWKYIIEDSGAKMLIAGPEKIFQRVKEYPGKVGKIESVMCFDDVSSAPEQTYNYWMKKVASEAPVPEATVTKDDLTVIIYTSGTTGNPKGVCLSHGNIVSMIRGMQVLWQDRMANQTALAFLPWAHCYGQSAEVHTLVATGSSLGIVPTREQLMESIGLIKPTMICAVPMLFNKVYDGVMKQVNEGSPAKRSLFHHALKVSRRRNAALAEGKSMGAVTAFQHSLFDKIVFSKIREKLGGRIKFLVGGGAATGMTVLEFFEDIGVPICEGYGASETSPVITTSTPDWVNRKLGTVGAVIDGLDCRIVNPETHEDMPSGEEGEIVVSGPSVMVGYHNNKQANDEVFYMKDGKRFFKTGDMGKFVDGKFLKLTGRIKEQYKLVNGKYVVPAPLEDMLTRSQYIAQAFVYGDNKPYNVALIVPDLAELKGWVTKSGLKLPVDDPQALLRCKEVVDKLSQEVIAASQPMKSFERPKAWLAAHDPFTPDNFMLTPKLSIRRKNVMATYGDRIEKAYIQGPHQNEDAHVLQGLPKEA